MEPKQVLVIDNDVFYQELLTDILQQEGYLVKKASDGLQGLELVKKEPFFCIFVDLIMPKIDGNKFLQCIREIPALKDLPVTMVSGTFMENPPDLDKMGADFYLCKGPAVQMKKNIAEIIKKLESGLEKGKEVSQVLGAEGMYKRAAVEELLSLKHHHEVVLGNMGEAVIETDPDLRVTYINPAGKKFFNKTEGQIIGSNLDELFTSESAQKIRAAVRTISDLTASRVSTITLSFKKYILKIVLASLVEAGENTGTILIAEDVTDYYAKMRELMLANERVKKMQDKLIQDAKFSMLGQLSANLSREIENPLVSALSYISLLLRQKSEDEATRERLEVIQEEMLRARSLIRDLIDFGGEEETKLERIEIGEILRLIVALVKNRAESLEVTLVENYQENLPLIYADGTKMKQVFINLINNAFEAMPNGGTLTITATTTTDETLSTAGANGIIQIEVADTGVGISPEFLPQIFNPFFSAKPEKNATGLGLSTSLKIIQSLGGTIEVKSKVGEGSIFTIKVPAFEEKID